jgi:hypothetical protein
MSSFATALTEVAVQHGLPPPVFVDTLAIERPQQSFDAPFHRFEVAAEALAPTKRTRKLKTIANIVFIFFIYLII